jgi:hypothetical protein
MLHCLLPSQVNQLLTLLGMVHIAFQPLIINHFLFSEFQPLHFLNPLLPAVVCA